MNFGGWPKFKYLPQARESARVKPMRISGNAKLSGLAKEGPKIKSFGS